MLLIREATRKEIGHTLHGEPNLELACLQSRAINSVFAYVMHELLRCALGRGSGCREAEAKIRGPNVSYYGRPNW